MVHFKYLSIFILIVSQTADTKKEEITKIVIKPKHKVSAEDGEHFQCDLVLLPQQQQMMYYDAYDEGSFDVYKWPKNGEGHVIVPYRISKASHYPADQVSIIRHAMDAIERETCIRFRPRKFEKDFVNIFSGRYCKSNLGRTGGAQELSLNWKLCMKRGIIIHELLHALGYIHMHNRPNRDKYVKIVWNNIKPSYFKEFERVNPSQFNYYGTPYDYHSIMHYSSTAFTRNGGQTIVPKDDSYARAIGHREQLSEGDIKRINNKYNCDRGLIHKAPIELYSKYTKHEPHKVHEQIADHEYHGYRVVSKDDDVEDLFNI